MTPPVTPEMWGYMAATAALEKAAKAQGQRGKGSAKWTSKFVSGAKKHLGRVGRMAKKNWKPLAAGAAGLGAGGAAFGVLRSGRDEAESEE